jgi:hypothetical protein
LIDRQEDGQIARYMARQTGGKVETGRWIDRQTDRWIDRKTNRQVDG